MRKNVFEETYKIELNGRGFTVTFTDERGCILVDGKPCRIDVQRSALKDHLSLIIDGSSRLVGIENLEEPGRYRVYVGGFDFEVESLSSHEAYLREFIRAAGVGASDNSVIAPMPGLIVKLQAVENSEVNRGQGILVMEAMKMENEIKAPTDGRLKKLYVSEGEAVEKGQVLFEIG